MQFDLGISRFIVFIMKITVVQKFNFKENREVYQKGGDKDFYRKNVKCTLR